MPFDERLGYWAKDLQWRGVVTRQRCKDHSFAWSGRIPCTGEKRCIYCNKPAGVPDDQPDHSPRNF